MLAKTNEPVFHETATLPVHGRTGGLRVMILPDGEVFEPLVRYFDLPKHRRKSPTWQAKASRAVGLLFDYTRVTPAPALQDIRKRRSFLSGFVTALLNGTVGEDGHDPRGLYWRPASWAAIKSHIKHVSAFADYCADEYGTENPNPLVAADLPQQIAGYRALDRKNQHSLLQHLGNAKSMWEQAAQTRAVAGPRPPSVLRRRPMPFPEDHIGQFISDGFERMNRDGAPLWERYSLRDLMLVILQRYGGLRASEGFHLFITDVERHARRKDEASVRLYHPALGGFTYRDPLAGLRTVTRREFLSQRYGRLPRNELTNKERAGWKDLMLEEGAPHYYAHVHWFPR
ncbi:MAG: hypothetical protein ACYC28_07680, partial [Longimicrobiales bacterium]